MTWVKLEILKISKNVLIQRPVRQSDTIKIAEQLFEFSFQTSAYTNDSTIYQLYQDTDKKVLKEASYKKFQSYGLSWKSYVTAIEFSF